MYAYPFPLALEIECVRVEMKIGNGTPQLPECVIRDATMFVAIVISEGVSTVTLNRLLTRKVLHSI